jgi:hypothetical protein
MASDEKRIGGCTREEWRSSLLDPASVYAPNDPIVGRYTASVDALLTAAFSPSSFQAGAEQMREAAAKLAESKSDRAWYAISYTSSLSQRIASTIRALPLPVAPEEGR